MHTIRFYTHSDDAYNQLTEVFHDNETNLLLSFSPVMISQLIAKLVSYVELTQGGTVITDMLGGYCGFPKRKSLKSSSDTLIYCHKASNPWTCNFQVCGLPCMHA